MPFPTTAPLGSPPPFVRTRTDILVHLGAGIGNIVFATPLLVALGEMGFAVDVWLAADYAQTADLLRPWDMVRCVHTNAAVPPPFGRYSHVLPATPPFYWRRFAPFFAKATNLVPRPHESLFYQDEQEFNLSFARALGYATRRKPFCTLPIPADQSCGVTSRTVVLAPGCKTGEMSAKRWPHFAELAEAYEDVAVVGTTDDLHRFDGSRFCFPSHVKMLAGELTLRQTAEVLASAGVVVANDSGLAHVAGAVGAQTIIIFGPTPERTLGRLPPNVTVLRQGLPCEPCWFQARFRACGRHITCLEGLTVEAVIETIKTVAAIATVTGRSPCA
jgi:hypothetical protein